MKASVRLLVAILIASAASLSLAETADAQGRRAVRVARPRTAVFIGGYYNPFFYDPFYPSWYFSPYAQWYPPYYGYGYAYDLSSSLRLRVAPRETEVFIDGYYAGTVDDFDGVFQRLRLEPGDHDLELYLPGHRSVQQKVYLQPGRTFTVRQTMEPLGAGEAPAVRPSGSPLPSSGEARSERRRPGPRDSGRRSQGSAAIRDDDTAFGSLSLRVQPGDAEVLIDGQRWQGSPDDERLVVQLAPGPHRIEIRKEGYRSFFTEVTVRSRETATLNVAMTPQ